MLSDEDHDDLIRELHDHVGRITIRAPPPMIVVRAIRVLEEMRSSLKNLHAENTRLKREAAHKTTDSLY